MTAGSSSPPPAGRRASRVLAAAVAVVLGAGLLVACTGDDGDGGPVTTATDTGPRAGGTLRIGLSGPVPAGPGSVSPGDAASLLAADLLWDSLTTLDDDGRAGPGLALEWEADDDATTWELTLDPDATFSDGSPIDADAVVAALEQIAVLGTGSLAATRLEVVAGHAELVAGEADGLAGLEAVADDVVAIELSEPFGALPELLASPLYGIASAAADEVVGSGAFEVEALGGGAVRLTPRAGADTYVEAIELVAHDSAEDALTALAAGDVDLVPVAPGVDLDGVLADLEADDSEGEGTEAAGDVASTIDVHEVLTRAEVFLGLRVDASPLETRALRRAIAAAIDREALVDAAYGTGARPLSTLVPAGVLGHDPDVCGELCGQDLDEAGDLLDEAFPDGDLPPVRLDIDDVRSQRDLAAALTDQLSAIGLTVEVEAHGSGRYATLLATGDQAAFTFGWIGLHPFPDAYLAPLLGGGSPDNYTGFSLAELDALVDETRRAEGPGPLDRWSEVEADLLDEAVLIPIAQLYVRVAVAPHVAGLTLAPDGTLDPTTIWLRP